MNELFQNIDAEKRDRIINSALEEFSKNRFDKASTNTIVKNANISKGLLFHYFKSKKELYHKLEKFSIQIVTDAIAENLDWEVADFFERMKQIVLIKGEVTFHYPYIYDFLAILIEERTLAKLREGVEERSNDLIDQVYTHNIDFSKFREDVDFKIVMEIIKWTFEKYVERLVKERIKFDKEFNFKEIEQELEQYIKVLKKACYKE